MWFGVLGPLCVRCGGREAAVRAGRQRVLLAALLVRANQVVSGDELVETVWDGRPPGRAEVTLRSYVRRLRQVLGAGAGERVETRSPGYLIAVSGAELDLLEFDRLCRGGGAAVRAGDWDAAVGSLGAALGLWRAEPLADVPSETLRQSELPRLTQQRLQALEWWIEAGLRLGRHAELVPRLRELVDAHPLREHFGAQLMTALAATGRRAEALDEYRRLRRTLADELGIDPGTELVRVQRQVLAADPALGPPAVPSAISPAISPDGERSPPGLPVPRQLPPAVDPFVGRHTELAALDGLLRPDRPRPAGATPVAAVHGAAGVGKTALAVAWAHRVADRFPDGQLYADLRGFGPADPPAPPDEVVRGFLHALGVPADRIPAGLAARVALYRSVLAGRRVLVVLDNARDADHVRPLLPAAAGCLAVVTGRTEPVGLAADGATTIGPDVLTVAQARELLSRRIGASRVAAEPAAAEALVAACGRLPLALCLVAARAATHATFPLSVLVDQVRAEGVGLAAGDRSVRSVFSSSYRALDRAAATMFRLLGVGPAVELSLFAAASLAGVPPDRARAALDRLCRVHLVAEPAPGRFTCHDLLRVYAAELSRGCDGDTRRRQALRRLLDHYLHTAGVADRLLNPTRDPLTPADPSPGTVLAPLRDRAGALDWFATEYPALVDGVRTAARSGLDEHAWQLPWLLGTFLDWQCRWQERAALLATASRAARRRADPDAQARILRDLGATNAQLGHYPQARAQLRQALRRYQGTGDRIGTARAHGDLAWLHCLQGHHRQALVLAQRALTGYRRAGHRPGQADSLNAVGWYQAQLGHHRPALTCCRRALAIYRAYGDRQGEADTTDSLGGIHRRLGHHAEAIRDYRRAAALWHEVGGRYGQAQALTGLGDTYRDAGDPAAARRAWQRALAVLTDLHHPDAGALRARLRHVDATPAPPPVVTLRRNLAPSRVPTRKKASR